MRRCHHFVGPPARRVDRARHVRGTGARRPRACRTSPIEQVLRIDLGKEPPTLDPNKAQDSTSIAVLHALNRGLVYFDKDLKVVPELAEALPTVSADAKTLTFTLKDGSSTATATRSSPVTSCTAEADDRSANRGSVCVRLCEIEGADAPRRGLGCGTKPAPIG